MKILLQPITLRITIEILIEILMAEKKHCHVCADGGSLDRYQAMVTIYFYPTPQIDPKKKVHRSQLHFQNR